LGVLLTKPQDAHLIKTVSQLFISLRRELIGTIECVSRNMHHFNQRSMTESIGLFDLLLEMHGYLKFVEKR